MARASQLRLSNLLLVYSFGLFGFKIYFVAEGLHFVVVETLAETSWLLWFLNHKKSVGVWLLIGFQVICFQNNLNTGGKLRLTRRLRRIHNAWRFQIQSGLVFTAQWFRLGGRVVHHLTRR